MNNYFKSNLHYFIVLSYFFLNLILSSLVTVPTDAADHWVWSRSLQLSYIEHPAMIALLMRFFSIISPFSEVVTLKIGSAFLFSSTILMGYFLANYVYSRKTALIYISLLSMAPYFMPGGLFLSINILMLFFWVLGLLLVTLFIRTKQFRYLLIFAAVAGIGGMSKYIYVLLCLALVIYFIYDSKYRFVFKSPLFYLVPIISLFVFSPVIIWNVMNDFISFTFVFKKGVGSGFSFINVIGVLIFQTLLYSPFIVLPFWYYFITKKFNFEEVSETKFIKVATLTPFLFFTISGFFGKVADPFWLDSTYVGAFLLLSNYLSKHTSKMKFVLISSFSYMIFFLVVLIVGLFIVLPRIGVYNLTSMKLGDAVKWDITGKMIEQETKEKLGFMPKYIASTDYQLAGGLSLYIPSQPLPFSTQRYLRNQWLPVSELKTEGFLLICPPHECERGFNVLRMLTGEEPPKVLFEHKTIYGKTPIRWFYVYYYKPIN